MPLQISEGYQYVPLTKSDTNYPNRDGGVSASNANYTQLMYGIWVGGTGTVALQGEDGNTTNFTAVPVGTLIPVRFKRLMSTNTNATLCVGLYPRP